MENPLNLFEITGQESGIVVFANRSILVADWNVNDGLPRVMEPFGIVYHPEEAKNIEVLPDSDDVRTLLPGTVEIVDGALRFVNMMILVDDFNEIPALFGHAVEDGRSAELHVDAKGTFIPTPGKVYRVNEAIVIAPEGWS